MTAKSSCMTYILLPEELARRHRVYRFRMMMGPTYRADMWATLDADPGISVADLARRTYGSFATASQVKHDWKLLNAAHERVSAENFSEQTPARYPPLPILSHAPQAFMSQLFCEKLPPRADLKRPTPACFLMSASIRRLSDQTPSDGSRMILGRPSDKPQDKPSDE